MRRHRDVPTYEDVDEWLTAVELEPSALGLTEAASLGLLDVRVACNKYQSEPVCVDAIARGVTF